MNEFKDYKNIEEEREEPTHYFCKFTFGQFFTLLVLEVVTLGFVFYLGARYGNEYLKIGKEEKSVVTEVIAKGEPGQDAELQQMAREALSGNSDLKQRVKDLLDQQEGNKTPEAAPVQAETLPAEAALENQSIGAAGEPVAAQPMPQQETAPTNMQASPEGGVIRMKSPANAQYSVQVGSYPNIEEANLKIGDWRGRGYPAFMMIADIPDRGRWYRVRIGGFATKEDATTYMERLKEKENTEAIVVLNEQ